MSSSDTRRINFIRVMRGVVADRPDATDCTYGDEYHSTDENKFYKCVYTGGVLSWAEIGAGGGGGASLTGTYDCDAGVAVGDWVYVDAAGLAQQARANAAGTVGAIGIVTAKPTYATATVQFAGEVTLAGLTAGAAYYLSAATAGAMTDTAPSTVGQFVQRLGRAKSATVLLIQVDGDYVAL
jgi:hypothetical protein